MVYRSTKLFTGYSTCFRQHKAIDTHCRLLHGYSLEFKVVFEGELDNRNWVMDFGSFKKNGFKKWLSDTFDHTLIVSKDDPLLSLFKEVSNKDGAKLIVLEEVSCEKFAELVYKQLQTILSKQTRVKIVSVACIENKNNTAMFLNSEGEP